MFYKILSLILFRNNFEVIMFVVMSYCSIWYHIVINTMSASLDPFCCIVCDGISRGYFFSTPESYQVNSTFQVNLFDLKVLARWKGVNTLLKKLNDSILVVKTWSACEGVGWLMIFVSPILCPLPSCLHHQLSLFHPGLFFCHCLFW